MTTLFGQIPPIPCEWCGKPAHYKTREALQASYLGMWQAIVARNELSPDMPVYRATLSDWLNAIAGERPASHDAVAINTALHGNSDWEEAA